MTAPWFNDGPTGPVDFGGLGLPDPDVEAHRELYIRDGSRFVRLEDAPDPGRPNYTAVDAPKCPHGHFAWWAAQHCTRCTRRNSK